MTVQSIVLIDPVSGLSVTIMPADGVSAQVLDVAAPARAVEEDRAGAHGSYDTTRYLSAAAVSLSMLLYPGVTQTPEKFLDALGPLLTPALRPYLIVANDQWPSGPRQMTVRYDSASKPLSDPTNWPVQVSWKAPAGVWEASSLVNAVIQAFIATSTGFVFDVPGAVITSAGYVFPATSAPSPSQVASEGNAPSQWTAFLYGPAVGPKFANDTVGLTLEFMGDLTLGPGDYIALDSRAQTAYLNSDPGSSVLPFLNFSASSWWLIQPGLNVLRYYPSSASPGAQANLSFRPAWLT